MSARCLLIVWSVFVAVAADAAEVKVFRADSREAALAGTLEGLSVDPLGGVELARRLERLSVIDEPFVFSAAALADGWVVGTGNAGKILKIDRQGVVSELAALPEPEIFAVHAGDNGTLYAASSPRGKVYRLDAGVAEVVHDPEDAYVWDLATDAEGRLLVATGLAGRLLRVGAGGDVETLYESHDSHVRSIQVAADGTIFLGTAGNGLLVRLGPDGEAVTLHDAVHPEIVDLALAPSGRLYAALAASEASFVDLSANAASQAGEEQKEQENGGGGGGVTVVVPGSETVGSRSSTFSGPRSLVLEISPDGEASEVARFASETVHSLLWHEGELWIGTGQEGKLYCVSDQRLIQEATLEDRQIVGLVAGTAGAAAVTANASALYHLHAEAETEGTWTSSVLDAAQVARFGSFQWRGRQPQGAGVEVAFRSGMSGAPDATWTPWSESVAVRCTGCDAAGNGAAGRGSGQDTAFAGVASGRYVQWRAKLARRSKGDGPRLEGADLSYLQDNLKPEIEKLAALDPGEILVPASFNPQNQTFEPWSPNRDGIFTTLRLERPKEDGRFKKLWKKGYRTLQWSAKDANSDPLTYRLDFRPEPEADGWLPMAEAIDESHYSFDATALPDGAYRFRLIASDSQDRSGAEALSDEKLSRPVVIDNTPPMLESVRRTGASISVELADALSPIRNVALSIDAGQWRPVPAADGLLDGRRETLRVEVQDGARLVLLRVSDAAHNVIAFDLLAETD